MAIRVSQIVERRAWSGAVARRLAALFHAACVLASVVGVASAHVIERKATHDHPQFATHCQVLPDAAFLAYYVRPGSGPTLVLLPETHGDRTQFYQPTFLAGLAPEWRLVVIESRGQGRSWPPPVGADASIERYADDVLAVVRHLKLPRWYVCGHSLGGMIALEIAGRRPPGLKGVVTLEGWVHARVQRNAFPDTTSRSAAEQAEIRRQREERYRTQRWQADEVAALGRIWTRWTRGEAVVAELTIPLLSLWGDRGRASRPSRARLLLPDRANIELHWIAGAGHYITDPGFAGEVSGAITDFVRRVEGADRAE